MGKVINVDSPICKTCKHYVTNKRCKAFGTKNVVTGDVYYESVHTCRKDATMCGLDGNCYEFYKFHPVRNTWYTFKDLSPYILLWGGLALMSTGLYHDRIDTLPLESPSSSTSHPRS